MARDAVVSCPAGEYTELTAAAVTTNVSIAVLSAIGVEIIATADGAATPAETERGFPLPGVGDGWSEATLAAKFPGVASAARLYAQPLAAIGGAAQVRISHG